MLVVKLFAWNVGDFNYLAATWTHYNTMMTLRNHTINCYLRFQIVDNFQNSLFSKLNAFFRTFQRNTMAIATCNRNNRNNRNHQLLQMTLLNSEYISTHLLMHYLDVGMKSKLHHSHRRCDAIPHLDVQRSAYDALGQLKPHLRLCYL